MSTLNSTSPVTVNGVTLTANPIRRQEEILTPDALDFLTALHSTSEQRRQELLEARRRGYQQISAGHNLGFLSETAHIRNDTQWQVPPPAPGLEGRRVEITGPVDRKMAINALNSGAKVWLADMEDSSSHTWANVIGGQINLVDALERRIDFTTPEGKEYKLGPTHPTIVVRPRGWHLPEAHLLIGAKPLAGAIVDFGLYFFHNAKRLMDRGVGPYFYLPKMESHEEARLWNDVFIRAQELIGIARGTIRATVLIETITAAFEMEEILYELREHAAGLNAGRWDYLFSLIKNFRSRGPQWVLPDRNDLTMTAPFMRAYTEQLVRACHRRGAMAIGGMAAFIPSRRDPEVNAVALAKVRADKEREAADGFDGSWVAHPDLVPVAMEVFDATLGGAPNQLGKTREDVPVDTHALLDVSSAGGAITEQGIRTNIEVGIRYIESWLRGTGAAAIHNLMEDAATAEISRSQIWQWVHAQASSADGTTVTREWVLQLVEEEFGALERFEGDRFDQARVIFEQVALGEDYPDFLTLPAYHQFLE